MDKKYIISTLVIILLMGVSVYAAPTSRIERTILPEADSTYDLGSTALRWANIFGDLLNITDLIATNTTTTNATTTNLYISNDLTVDGDTTIVDLYLTNEIVSGYTTTTLGLFTQGDLHIGGNSTFDGTGHDSFSDFVANEHIDWTGATDDFSTTGTIHSDGNITTNGSVDGIDIAGMSGFVTLNSAHRNDITGADHSTLVSAVGTNTGLAHAESHDIASHSDTTATGAELDDLTDNSMADTLHRHSELSASDGTPDRALIVNASGNVGIGTTAPDTELVVKSVATSGNHIKIWDTSWGNDE